MPLLPWGQWKPDLTDYEGADSKNLESVIPRGDGYGPFRDFAALSQALVAACRGAFYALKSDGTVVVFAGTSTKLYLLNGTTYAWSDVSLAAGSYAALSDDAQWQFAQFGSLVFATQENVALQVYDLSLGGAFSNALGSPPQAAYIAVVGRFLVLSGLLSTPFRIQWSGLNSVNAATSWDGVTAGSDSQDFPDGGIVRGVSGGEFGLVFQDQAIRRMSYIPGSALIFQIERISKDLGVFAPYSIINAGEWTFFHSAHGFYKVAPGGRPEQIGRERVDSFFFADLDKTELKMFIGAADPQSTKVFWGYRSTSGAADLYDKIIGYDYTLDRWFTVTINGEYLLGMSQPGITLESLDSISGSIDALGPSLDSFAVSTQPMISQFNGSHMLGFFSGDTLEATLETSEQGTDGRRIFVRGFRPVTDAATLYGSASYRETQQATATAGDEVLISSRTGRCDLRRSTRYSRFKIRIPAATAWVFAAGIEPDVVQDGTL